MGLLEADPGPEYRVKAGRNKISPESNIESKPVELAPVQNWQEGNHGPEAPKRAFEKEKSRRRCAKIAIMISTIVIVLIVVLTPVSVYLAKNEKSKGTAPTKSSGTARPSTAPTTTSPKATNASTRTVIVNTTVIRTTARPTLRTTTVSRTCTPFLPTSNHSSHHWRCSDENNVASTCVLTCNQVGFVSLKPESKCLSSGLWSRQWSECIASNPCELSTHNCSALASCKSTQPGKYRCTCNAGFAGDGINCGNDTDADGIPDKALPCTSKSCTMDNCVSLPNSGQEDFDGDGKGDACDDDDDNDGISDSHDNCPLVSNAGQTDREPDGVGDACDNCPSVNNTDQVDTNKNGIGDACESDVDSDGVLNESDNCVLVYNPDQKDNDTDGVGDVCDNCRDVANADQKDEDDNLVGDACQDGPDLDSDGIKDKYDNCKDTANGDQTDTDRDDVGDACDADKDGDGIENLDDNCPLVANRDQVDGNKNGIGDACEDDDDGDGVDNDKDDFPLNALKNQTDFRVSDMVIFDGKGTAQDPPKWFQFDQGREILQTINGNPGALLSKTFFGDLIFTGTLMIRSPPFGVTPDDDYVGIIFGFQSNRKFYVCSWKRGSQSYNLKNAGPYPRAYGRKGISLKKFHSSTGPGIAMRDALWETGNAINQSTLLWHDKSPVWSFNVSYQWKLVHNPDSGRMRISWYQGKNIISDSGNIVDKSLRGGRVGVFVFSQENVYFSAMRTKNTKISDNAIEFDGQNSYIDIGSQSDLLNGEQSFTVELWTRIEGVSNTSCMPPRNIDFGTIDHSETHFFAQDANDERDWQFPNVIIPSKTSPEFDHTSNNGTGRFAYFRGRWTGYDPYLGDRARLLSPWFPANDSCALDFFLHMWDADATVAKTQMGSLQIEVRDTDKIWKQRFWIKGNQNNTWHQRKVLLQDSIGNIFNRQAALIGQPLHSCAGVYDWPISIPNWPTTKGYSDIQMRITAVRGHGSRSDIAIDDLNFSPGCGTDSVQTCKDDSQYLLGSENQRGLFLFIKRGQLFCGFSGNETVTTSSSEFQFGQWNHVAMVFNSSDKDMKIFVNGKLAASKVLSSFEDTKGSRIFIGKQGNSFLKGFVDEVRIWKKEMDAARIMGTQTISNLDDLQARYSFNDGEGPVARDSSPTRYTATIHKGVWVQSFRGNN